jgi:hypothetical protein
VDILGGRSHIWHKKESVRYTDLFGKFAARVCSKILGIGSAERAWGDVKHLKTNKRSHLSSDRVKKQATIFGASCMLQANMRRELPRTYQYDGTWKPVRYWTEDDYNVVYNMDDEEEEDEDEKNKSKRTFKAWIEDWETEAVRKNDPVAENQLLRKYGGLMWKDPDCKDFVKYFLADNNSMKWYRLTKNNGGGWALIAYDQFFDEKATKEEQEQHSEPWAITEDLISCIEEYYTILNPNSEVRIIKQKNDSDSD